MQRTIPSPSIERVVTVVENTVVFYHYEGDSYEQQPFQEIVDRDRMIKTPDGLAFSSQGELLAITNHGDNSILLYQQIPQSGGRYTEFPVEIIRGEHSNLHFPHSLSFHPSHEDLVVSNAGGKKTLLVFKKVATTFPRYAHIPEQVLEIYNPETVHLQRRNPEEGGVKGVAISPDGQSLGLCASDIAYPDRSVLIYPLSN